MKKKPICRSCQVPLTKKNWTSSRQQKCDYHCSLCERNRAYLRRQQLKEDTIAAYGGCCICCGECTIEFLAIDHIDGGGAEHRRTGGRAGTDFYQWLKKQDYPKDNFQLLCFNCNFAKGAYGICPHKRDIGD